MDTRELYSAARLVARKRAKYFGRLLMKFAPVETPGLGTIGVTEHGVLMVDWEFFNTLHAYNEQRYQRDKALNVTTLQIAGALVHECFHIVLNHCARTRSARRDPGISNVADDMSFNPAVLDMGLQLPVFDGFTPCFPEQHGWERGLTSDEYYERLLNESPPQPQRKPGTGGGHCGSCAGNPFPHEPDGSAEASRSKAEMERAVRDVARAVREEAQRGERGAVPGFLQRAAELILAPAEVPWEQELGAAARHAVAWSAGACDHKYDAPSRRQAGLGFGLGRPVLPRLRRPVPSVAIIIDTSGSMDAEALGTAAREATGVLKATGANVQLLVCDAQVHGVTKVRSLKEVLAALKGGGGTNMRPAIDAALQLQPCPDVLVCITDLCIGDPGPAPRNVRMIWVGVGELAEGPYATKPAWGKTIIVKTKKKEGAA